MRNGILSLGDSLDRSSLILIPNYIARTALRHKTMDPQRAYIIRAWVADYTRYVAWAKKTTYVCPIELYYQQACADLHIEMRDLVQAWEAR